MAFTFALRVFMLCFKGSFYAISLHCLMVGYYWIVGFYLDIDMHGYLNSLKQKETGLICSQITKSKS